jgi:hypothetical protein
VATHSGLAGIRLLVAGAPARPVTLDPHVLFAPPTTKATPPVLQSPARSALIATVTQPLLAGHLLHQLRPVARALAPLASQERPATLVHRTTKATRHAALCHAQTAPTATAKQRRSVEQLLRVAPAPAPLASLAWLVGPARRTIKTTQHV